MKFENFMPVWWNWYTRETCELSTYIGNLYVNVVKFGEPLTDNADGNPEPSLKYNYFRKV
jgi:hypothetical protein